MSTLNFGKSASRPDENGWSLSELLIASSILLILSAAALPIVRYRILGQKETELRRDLREMRDAIDCYKDLADAGKIRVEAGTEGYAPDLRGVNVGPGSDKKIRFLRRIPKDPITGHPDWGLRAIQDDPDSTSWSGHNVFDEKITT